MEAMKSVVSRGKLRYCGNDPLPIFDIINSDTFHEVSQVFLERINVISENNIFPETEKLAIVKAIAVRKLNSQCLSSYRPVINLTYLSKIIENVILNQLLEHCRRWKPFKTMSVPISDCIQQQQLCVL